ncbi:MAG: dihydropteroate synthase [Thermoplasmata archaeon]|nr:dihydropteroate synthase [Thermoplasmata archaeon]
MGRAPSPASSVALVAKYHARVVEPEAPADRGGHRLLHLGPVATRVARAIRERLPASVRLGQGRLPTARVSNVRLVQMRASLPELARLARDTASPEMRELALAGRSAFQFYTRSRRVLLEGLHRSCRLGEGCRVMGVLNLTPDSFSDGGRFLDPRDAVAHAERLLAEGAHLLDLGAESTRPGARPVSARAEWARLAPVLARLHAISPVPLSVDTRKPEVARRALANGADLVNDVGGLRSEEMRSLLARTGAPAIAMHMRGSPARMQRNTRYADLRGEVYGFLAEAVARALRDGVGPEQLLVDPGLGFGKTPEQSLELLAHAGEFRSLGLPVVVGASRKSMLGFALGGAPVNERAEAGLAAAVIAAREGASIVRVHEVGPTVRALALLGAVERAR